MARRLGNSNRQAERSEQQALQARLNRKFEASIRRQISSAMLSAAASFSRGDDYLQAVLSHNDLLERLLVSDWTTAAQLFGNRLLGAAKSMHGAEWARKNQPDDPFNAAIALFVRNLTARKVVEISNTTQTQIRAIVNRGIDEGMGVDAIARAIRAETPIRAALRAHVIARTETHSAAGFGSQAAASATNLPLRKEWIAARDDRTRENPFDHAGADGEVVDIGQPFMATGEALMYPGDPSGSAGNVIMCRCAAGYLFEE